MAKKTVTMAEWGELLAAVDVSKDQINRLVMNFLVVEGYKDAVVAFQVCCYCLYVVIMSAQDRCANLIAR